MARLLAMLWIVLYTAGLTEAQKANRRSEILSDMHEQLAFTQAQSYGPASISMSIASRTARGMVADILWRLEEGQDGEEVVKVGASPPLPWFTMGFVSAVIVTGCFASTQVAVLGDGRVLLAFLAAGGAGLLWLGLCLTTRQLLGPVCITAGTLCIAIGFWWTLFMPLLVVCLGISGLRRAQRIETILRGD